jgi:hypothetical protein
LLASWHDLRAAALVRDARVNRMLRYVPDFPISPGGQSHESQGDQSLSPPAHMHRADWPSHPIPNPTQLTIALLLCGRRRCVSLAAHIFCVSEPCQQTIAGHRAQTGATVAAFPRTHRKHNTNTHCLLNIGSSYGPRFLRRPRRLEASFVSHHMGRHVARRIITSISAVGWASAIGSTTAPPGTRTIFLM